MTPTSLHWLRLEVATPHGEGDARFLINGRPVPAEEFHAALVSVDRAVFAIAMADAILADSAVPS